VPQQHLLYHSFLFFLFIRHSSTGSSGSQTSCDFLLLSPSSALHEFLFVTFLPRALDYRARNDPALAQIFRGLNAQDWKFSTGMKLATNVTPIGAKPKMQFQAMQLLGIVYIP
jgi:hypothetical protein